MYTNLYIYIYISEGVCNVFTFQILIRQESTPQGVVFDSLHLISVLSVKFLFAELMASSS